MVAELSILLTRLDSSKGSVGFSATVFEDMITAISRFTGKSVSPKSAQDKKCNYCENIGHIEANCWSNQGFRPVRFVQTDGQNLGIEIKSTKPNSENVGIVMEACNQKIVGAAKCEVDVHPVSKQQRTERELIHITSLLNPELTEKERKPMKKQSVRKIKISKRSKENVDIREHVGRYNLMDELARA